VVECLLSKPALVEEVEEEVVEDLVIQVDLEQEGLEEVGEGRSPPWALPHSQEQPHPIEVLLQWEQVLVEVVGALQLLELLLELLRLRLTSSKAAVTTLTRLSRAGHLEVEGLLTPPLPVIRTALLPLMEEDREEEAPLLPSVRLVVLGEEERLRKSRSTIRCRFPCT
jgi:hypothetical protein